MTTTRTVIRQARNILQDAGGNSLKVCDHHDKSANRPEHLAGFGTWRHQADLVGGGWGDCEACVHGAK